MPLNKPETVTEQKTNVASISIAGIGCLVPLGVVLTFTGIGAIIGVPLLLIGLFTFFSGMIGSLFVRGKTIICPYCYEETKVTKNINAYTCPRCQKRVLIEGDSGRKVET